MTDALCFQLVHPFVHMTIIRVLTRVHPNVHLDGRPHKELVLKGHTFSDITINDDDVIHTSIMPPLFLSIYLHTHMHINY